MKQKCKIKVSKIFVCFIILIFSYQVGHGGTLDPLAEGVLVLGIGDGTKSMANFLSGSKGYFAVGKLGTATGNIIL